MKDVIRIAIVDPSDATREPMRNLILGVESIWLDAECSRYEFFLDVIRGSLPDVAVVALDSDHAKALQLISTVSAEYPNIPILAVSSRADGQSILQSLRAGAKEFLTQPIVLEELLTVMHRLHGSRYSTDGSGSNGTVRMDSLVVAVVGSRGGVGTTTIAVNLGCTLAQDPNLAVAMIDLDMALGDADVALDLMPDYTLADVALNVERLDMMFLKKSLAKHASGLSLLPHPVQMEDIGLIHEEHLQRVIGLLRASYTHLILDLSKRFTPTDITALHMADVILLVAQLELTSLRNVVRILHSLGNDEALNSKVRVVLTRVGSDQDLSLRKAEETLGKPVFWQVPNDSKHVLGARDAGEPLLQFAPRCRAQQSIFGLAQALCGQAPPEPVPAKKSGFFSFR